MDGGLEVTVLQVEHVMRFKGTVVTGVLQCDLAVGDRVEVRTAAGATARTIVSGIERFMKVLDRAAAGENVGLLLRGIADLDVTKGDTVYRVDE